MVLRLSELLERIRPAGTPGAPADGEDDRQQAAIDEIGDVARVLARFEREADGELTAARERARLILVEAEQRAHRISAALADRIAVASARGAQALAAQNEAALDRITTATTGEIARLQCQAGARMTPLVDAAIEQIWRVLPPPARKGCP
jgi:vacuolar-type H+-ATPase subunit H